MLNVEAQDCCRPFQPANGESRVALLFPIAAAIGPVLGKMRISGVPAKVGPI